MSDATHTNRLIDATSPYLLQHAHNPVDWYEWGPEALERARDEDKPILLSIGYSACHWCHVMAHESFEDPATAAFMNEHFIPIKVDREERPDVDAVYMDAVQAMTGHGGWPLTAFLTPSGEPFYGGTYFPPEDRHGLPGFPKVLAAIDEAWRERRDRITEDGTKLTQALSRGLAMTESHDPLTDAILTDALRSIARTFDPEWGGFGPAPKFPQPSTLEFLLHMHQRGHPDALHMATTTLDKMAAGGIHDQVGGGFHRYSTDERWLVPHFEKMLYDNAQLARLYLHAWQVTGEPRYRSVVQDTLTYLMRDLRHPAGGFFSSQDADSEGIEGKFYVWSWDELVEVVGEPDARVLGAGPRGNWDGTNVLWCPDGVTAPGDEEVRAGIDRLEAARRARVPPATDDKVLASWNGLAIQAFAEAGRAMGEHEYLDVAIRAADFVLTNLRRDDRRLLRSWRDGRTSGAGFIDDYAAMALGCLSLYESRFEL
ncbi:MAG: thioredoxin domain-containing protein, partial [Actinobacteria bacterium]